MSLIPRSWTINRLRGRLQRVERARDEAMHSLVVRDGIAPADRPRHQFQDPGQVGTILDEIAELQHRIAGLQTEEMPGEAIAATSAVPEPVSIAFDGGVVGALGPAFAVLRAELTRTQRANPHSKIGVDELRQALRTALWSPEVLDAAFAALRAEMTRMQRANVPGRIGLDALRDALRASLAGPDTGAVAWNGTWPDVPGVPLDPDQDGWHWVRAPGKNMVVLSWHAETRAWGHRVGISPGKVAADGVRYFGPCVPPVPPGGAGEFGL